MVVKDKEIFQKMKNKSDLSMKKIFENTKNKDRLIN